MKNTKKPVKTLTLNKCLLLLIAATLVLSQPANGSTMVCRLAHIGGFDKEEEDAKKVVGTETTSKVREMKVYLTYSQKQLFVYGNFISKGADYQTKIVTDENTDLMTILQNLVFNFGDEEPTPKQVEEFRDALTSIKFYVQPALESSKYKSFKREIEELKT